jgi:uncharacterized protein involved in exopolysaccharide biosynthesis
MGAALAYTYVYSEQYRATTTILYRPNTDVRFEGVGQQQKTLGFPVPAVQPFEAFGLTIRQVGTSERILRPVVVDLGLDQPDRTRHTGFARYYHATKDALKEFRDDAWQFLKYGRLIERNQTETAIEGLAQNTTIDTRQKNYAATLSVADKDPRRAAATADRIAAELIKFMKEQSVEAAHEQGTELEAQLGKKKAAIDRVRRAIEAHKVTHGFIDLTEETTLHLQTAERLQEKLLTTNAELNAARAKLQRVTAQREALAPMQKGSETTADDPLYTRLRGLQASLEVELQGLLERSPRESAELRGTQAQLSTARQLLAAVKPTRISQSSMELSKVYQTIHAEELKTAAEIVGVEAVQKSTQASLDQARARIIKPSVELKHNDLRMQLAVLESDYKKLSTRREEVRAVELTSKAEVYALHPATPPETPFRPIKVYHVLLSGLLALILGVGFVYLVDYVRSLLAVGATAQGQGST